MADDLFDFGAKKKKKSSSSKKTEEAAPAAAPAAAVDEEDLVAKVEALSVADASVEDDSQLFSDLKKKKKKSKKTDEVGNDAVAAEPASTEEPTKDDVLLPLGEMKKKKKKKLDMAQFEAELGESAVEASEAAEGDDDFTSLKKKKKKGKSVTIVEDQPEDEPAGAAGADEEEDGGEDEDEEDLDEDDDEVVGNDEIDFDEDDSAEQEWQKSDRDYAYDELLARAFRLIRRSDPEYGSKRKYTMIPPQILREGTKKTVFANLADICKKMHRQQEHVIQFLFSELGTSGSVDGNQRLVIKGRFQSKQIENVLRKYILEYVTCKICRSPDTILTKENRILFVFCETCNSKRSVTTIKSGFSAQIGRRKR